jgi:hypothetical protein
MGMLRSRESTGAVFAAVIKYYLGGHWGGNPANDEHPTITIERYGLAERFVEAAG